MPMLIPFMYFITGGFKFLAERITQNEKKQMIILSGLQAGYLIIFANCMLFLLKLYIPIYIN